MSSLPEKPKDKWINAKAFSWFYEYDNEPNISEEDWYFEHHVSLGLLMQILADEAERNGIEIIRCKDCVFCEYNWILEDDYCHRNYLHGGGTIFGVDPEADFCSKGEKR